MTHKNKQDKTAVEEHIQQGGFVGLIAGKPVYSLTPTTEGKQLGRRSLFRVAYGFRYDAEG